MKQQRLFLTKNKRPTGHSLIKRGCLLILTLILLPVVMSSTYILTQLSASLEMQARENVDFYVNQLVEKNSTAMDLLRSSAESLIGNRDVRAVMTKSQEQVSSAQRISVQYILNSAILYNVAWADRYIDSVYLFQTDGALYSSTRSALFSAGIQEIEAIYAQYREFSSTKTLVRPDDNSKFVYFIMDYTDISTMKVCGKIIIRVNISKMIPAENLQRIYPGSDIVISDVNGNILSARGKNSPENLLEELRSFEQGGQQEEGQGYVRWRENEYYHSRQSPSKYELLLDIFVPRHEILHTARTTVKWYAAFALCAALGTLFGAFLLGRKLIRPVQHIIKTIESMGDGDLSVRMEKSGYQETDTLVGSFNRMADSLEGLYADAYDKGMLLRESEFRLLEAQINPHFIFNVLETVNLQCLEAGQGQTSRMVTDLAALLRASIGRDKKQKNTIAEELQYVQYYLNIQKARFADALSFQIDYADESLLSYYIPKLSIQPLVENSVVHGLEKKCDGGLVRIQLWEEDDSIYIRVEDDGVGFHTGVLSKGPSELNRHNHVALANIQRRLQLLYGPAACMRINSAPGIGTVVLLVIPIDEKEG